MNKLFTLVISFVLLVAPVGFAAENASDQFSSNPEAKAKGSMMNTLMVMSTSAMGTSIVVGCAGGGVLAGSSVVFAAGSLVYLLGEIAGGKDQNKVLKKRASDLELLKDKMSGGGDVQRAALEQALNEQKDTLKFINKRKMWLMAVNVAFTGAAGLAIAESIPPGSLLFAMVCPGVLPASSPWLLAIGGAYAATVGLTSGEPIAALLGPVLFVAAGIFVPGLTAPQTRAIVMSAAAATAFMLTSELGEKAKVVKENIEKLEKALAQFDSESGTEQNSSLAQTESDALANQTDRSGAAGSASLNALSGNTAALQDSKTCASKTSDGKSISLSSNCSNTLKLASSPTSLNANLPDLTQAAQTSAEMANAFAAGNIAAAEVSAASLNAMAARVNAAKDSALLKLNAKLAETGQPKLDLDGETKKMVASMNSSMAGAIEKGGAPLMAAVGPMTGLGSTSGLIKADESSKVTAVTSAPIDGPSLRPVTEAILPESGIANSGAVKPEKTDSLDNYEVNVEDVAKNSGASIWQQVSNRYLMNYGKFFERKRVESVTD